MAVMNLDYPVAQAAFFLMALTVVSMNLFVDFLYGYLIRELSINEVHDHHVTQQAYGKKKARA